MDRVVKVECHSGYSYPERPIAIELDDKRMEITQIINEARTPSGRFFLVRVKDQSTFELAYDEENETWSILPSKPD